MSIKILVTDPIADKGINLLKDEGFEIIYKPNIKSEEYKEYVNDIDGWIIRSGTKINDDSINISKKLQIIGRAGVGVDNIDIKSATSRGIIVMNVPDGNTVSAAEHTVAMLLSLSRNIQLGHSSLKDGRWFRHKLTGAELQYKTLGVVGLGKIGREVIKRARSFDMKIIGYDPYVSQEQFDEKEVEIVSLDELTTQSDYITIHVPMNDSTKDLFDLSRIKNMKSGGKDTDHIGPIITSDTKQKIDEHIDEVKNVCNVFSGVNDEVEKYIAPTIVIDPPDSSRIVNEETFGPVMSIRSFKTEDELIDKIHKTGYGLSSSIFGKDKTRINRIIKRMKTGSVNVNDVMTNYVIPSLPYGGEGISGLGKQHGIEGLRSYCRVKSIVINKFNFIDEPMWWGRPKVIERMLEKIVNFIFK